MYARSLVSSSSEGSLGEVPKDCARGMRVALIHYWLVTMRGGEKVLESLCRMFPEADIYTHVYDPRSVSPTIQKHKVQTSFIGRLPRPTRFYKSYLLLMPLALEQLDLRNYDLIISSEVLARPRASFRPRTLFTSATAIRPCVTCGTCTTTTGNARGPSSA